MKKLLACTLFLILLASCQHHRSSSFSGRKIANSSTMRLFIQEIANRGSGLSAHTIETQAIRYIKNKQNNVGNWKQMGISEDEAMRIKSLYDDVPYMNKVRKWVRSNITKVVRVEAKIAQEAYDVIMKGHTSYINPYKLAASSEVSQMVSSRRSVLSPTRSVNEHTSRVTMTINELPSSYTWSKKLKTLYKENLVTLVRRGKTNPSIVANANEIIESATNITKKTGLSGMGEGCKTFNTSASETILANKADIDLLRSQLIEERAYAKAGKTFGSFDEVPVAQRLTQSEVDDATVEAFKRINAMTDDEARAAVRRLKQKPCRIY
jgi:hypothetical protein